MRPGMNVTATSTITFAIHSVFSFDPSNTILSFFFLFLCFLFLLLCHFIPSFSWFVFILQLLPFRTCQYINYASLFLCHKFITFSKKLLKQNTEIGREKSARCLLLRCIRARQNNSDTTNKCLLERSITPFARSNTVGNADSSSHKFQCLDWNSIKTNIIKANVYKCVET